jgi:hypothetical protein
VSAMEKLREGFEDFAGPMGEALMADAEVEQKAAPKNEGRRRDRREQQRAGKATNATASKGKAS